MTRSHGSQTTFLAAPQSHAFYTQMKKNGQVLRPRRVMDHAAAVKQIELYCVAHPGTSVVLSYLSVASLGSLC